MFRKLLAGKSFYIVTIGFVLYWLFKWCFSPFHAADFNADRWKSKPTFAYNECVRGAMMADLDGQLKSGMDRNAVIRMLGEPMQQTGSTFRYYLGFCSGHMTDPDELVIEFDERGGLKGHTLFVPERND